LQQSRVPCLEDLATPGKLTTRFFEFLFGNCASHIKANAVCWPVSLRRYIRYLEQG
jgi:hypothetical protein